MKSTVDFREYEKFIDISYEYLQLSPTDYYNACLFTLLIKLKTENLINRYDSF